MDHVRRTRALAGAGIVAAALFAAGCSGGGSSAFHPLPVINGTNAPGSMQSSPASIAVKITIPKSATSTSVARRPAYVSPSTNSLTIAQNGGTPAVFAISATAPGCTSSASGVTCTLTIPATSGLNQLFSVATYASTNGTGTPLSVQNVVATIAANTTNQLNFTLNGVVASLSVGLSKWVLPAGQSGTSNVVVNALDAAGNIIVGPGTFSDASGNPLVITLSDSDGSGSTQLAQTTLTQASTVVLNYNGGGGVTSLTITASAPNLATKSIALTVAAASSASMTADQVSASLSDVVAAYQTMPHTNLARDLDSLATQMVQSGAYLSAQQTPGGITALLSDGTPVLIFADRPEAIKTTSSALLRSSGLTAHRAAPLGLVTSGSPSPSPTPSPPPPPPGPNPGPATGHEIAFLINTKDQSGAFTPANQQAFGDAFKASGFIPKNGYQVDVMPITLENIIALGQTHPVDFINVATHGMIFSYRPTPNVTLPPNLSPSAAPNNYANLSDTPYSDQARATYQSDFNAGRLVASVNLAFNGGSGVIPYIAFTPDFLVAHVTFNPGAVLVNSSCWGQNSLIASAVTATLKSAGVGRYIGWTKEVDGTDADETDAFLFDRLLGEQSPSVTKLEAFITPRTPPQRPFPLDDIQTVESTEMRGGPITKKVEPYTNSDEGFSTNALGPPISDGTLARLVVSDFGGETVANAPISYGLPSISYMAVAEAATNGDLLLVGSFPMNPGTVTITDSAGTQTFVPSSWSQTQIEVTIPASGAQSAGMVQVLTAEGIGSNVVPLTTWSGSLKYTETDQLTQLGGKSGSGTGTIEVDYAMNIRADVHPTVQKIDMAPVASNFFFFNPQGNSTATVATYNGGFDSDDGKVSSTYSLAPTTPALTPAIPPLMPGTFEVRAYIEGTQPSPCNNGQPGPQASPPAGAMPMILCPITGWYLPDGALTCNDSGKNAGCPAIALEDQLGSYGAGFDAGGLLSIKLNPATYALTVSGTSSSYDSIHFGGQSGGSLHPAVASMSGSFGAPTYAPVAMTGTSAVTRSAVNAVVAKPSSLAEPSARARFLRHFKETLAAPPWKRR